jgi:metal-responsive CopG/Arc/MetJ family transcriptional regulator
MATKKKQVLLTLGDELLKDIDNFWHENHIISRSEAIRNLLREALKNRKTTPKK